MFIDKKYFSLWTGEPPLTDVPTFFIDVYKLKPNLKLYHTDSHCFTFSIGLFKYCITIQFKWGYVERSMNERELERAVRISKFINDLKGDE